MNISRGSVYYTAKPVSDGDLKSMRCVDEFWIAPGHLKAARFRRAGVQVMSRENEDEAHVRMM